MRLHKNTFHCLHQAETLLFFIQLTVLKVKYRSSTPPSTRCASWNDLGFVLAYGTFTTAMKNYQMNVEKKKMPSPPRNHLYIGRSHYSMDWPDWPGCFTNVLRAFQINLAKIYKTRNDIYGANFTCTKFQLEIFIEVRFLQYINFERIFWRARETLVKQSPRWRAADSSSGSPQQSVPLSLWSIHDSLQKNKMKRVVDIGKTQMWTLTDRPRADLCKLKFMCLYTSNGKLKLLKLERYRLTTF